MQNTSWIALLKNVPAEFHNQLMITTAGGTEISMQTILVLDGDCLVFKGRLAGCQDAGRLFYVPYSRIDYVGFNRAVGEEEFRAWYADLSAPAQPAPPTNGTNGNGHAIGNDNGSGSGPRPVLPNRAALLDRIRSRPTMHGG